MESHTTTTIEEIQDTKQRDNLFQGEVSHCSEAAMEVEISKVMRTYSRHYFEAICAG